MIERLQINNWRQFDNLNLNFDSRLTVLTGTNGSGKTTILNILSKAFGDSINFVSNVRRCPNGDINYFPSVSGEVEECVNARSRWSVIGRVTYDSQTFPVLVPEEVSTTYQIQFEGSSPCRGLYINSHRSLFQYKRVDTIPTHALAREEIFNVFHTFKSLPLTGNYYNPTEQTATRHLKEALISLAMFGPGNQYVAQDDRALAAFEGFQRVLKKILPPNVGFRKLKIEKPEVILETDSGNFPIDAVSGGIASIIELAWMIYMYSSTEAAFTVLLDEPENHLHPELQQTLLPNLLEAFPHVQFIVATHNPFIISSVETSVIYALSYENEKVISTLLEGATKAASSNEILRNILGIKSTFPLWAADKIKALIEETIAQGITEETLMEFRAKMQNLGFADVIPAAINEIFRR